MRAQNRYFRHKVEKVLVVSQLITLGAYDFSADFRTSGEIHDFWEAVYVDRGRLLCSSGEKKTGIGSGEMIFHPPGEFHDLQVKSAQGARVLVINFTCRSQAMAFFKGKAVFVPKEIRPLLSDLLEEGKKTFDISRPDPEKKKMEFLERPALGGIQAVLDCLELFLIRLMRSVTETGEGNRVFLQKPDYDSYLIREIMDLMNENLYGGLSVEKICERTRYSRAYVYRRFREATGRSLMDYFTELRIRESMELLGKTEESIRRISERLGFDTPNYFSKVFKKRTGMAPLSFRKRQREEGSNGALPEEEDFREEKTRE